MVRYTDDMIETILEFLPSEEKEWELVGFVNKDKQIYTFGNDSKIIGRLFEVIVTEALSKTADKLGYTLHEAAEQTVYPDFYFLKPNGKRIAIDVKTTYRKFDKKGNVKKFGFTGGSFTSYMRNGTKNIEGDYSDYEKHYILGVLYSREETPTIGKKELSDLQDIVPAYKNPEVFVQEKFRICGDKKGSGNTDNIGTIKSKKIDAFAFGAGPFAFMGAEVFDDYWTNHPKYKDSDVVKDSLYFDIPSYIQWLKHSKNQADLALDYQLKYDKYLEWNAKKGW